VAGMAGFRVSTTVIPAKFSWSFISASLQTTEESDKLITYCAYEDVNALARL
jgi:hypothetical protein